MLVYFTQLLNKPVFDSEDKSLGKISDLAVSTGEVFPRVSSITFVKGKEPFMLSWQQVREYDAGGIRLGAKQSELKLTFLQPSEILLGRDLLDRQIVDTQGLKVVRVNDLKLTQSENELRLLGADIGVRGILRRLGLEKAVDLILRVLRLGLSENLIAWNYIDLLEKDLSAVKLSVSHKRLHELHPADIADILGQLDPAQRTKVFQYLDNIRAADAISESEPGLQSSLFESFSNERASDILEVMPPDDAADIIAGLPYEKAQTLLNLMGVKEASDIRKLLGYKEKTAGGIMTTDYIAVKKTLTVEETIENLRRLAPDPETVSYIYVVDDQNSLAGVLSLRDLVMASAETRVKDIMLPEVISVAVDDDQEEVANTISKYDLLAVPVVDENQQLLGIVTVDDVLEVMEEESTEDISILAGTPSPSLSLTMAPAASLLRRSSWLIILLLAGAITGAILRAYTQLLQSVVALAFFIPLVIRLSDDMSTQSIALVLQAIKTGEFDRYKIWKKAQSDIAVGLIIGILSGLAVWLLALLWQLQPLLGLIIAISLAITAALASMVGTFIPLLLNRLRIDPSSSLAPVITTFMGALGLLVYLGISALFQFRL